MILPRPRAAAILGVGLPVLLVVVAFDPDRWTLVAWGAGLFAMAVAVDGALLALDPMPEFAVSLPGEVGIGEPIVGAVEMSARNRQWPAAAEAIVELEGAAEAPGPLHARLVAGDTVKLDLPIAPQRRGIVRAVALWQRLPGPLGLMERRSRDTLDLACAVVPNVIAVQRMALELKRLSRDFGQKPQEVVGDGSEFEALREFSLGMDRRYVDWKQSARHRKLLAKEMKAERNHHVVMAFDTGYLMSEPIAGAPKLDHAINAGLKLASLALSSGDLVGLYSFGSEIGRLIRPIRGQAAFAQLRYHTAELTYDTAESNFTLALTNLSARLERRSLIVLFTDFVDTVNAELLLDNMRLLSKRHLILFVGIRDPLLDLLVDAPPTHFDAVAQTVVADMFMRDRTLVIERLKRLGVLVLDVEAEALGPRLINTYLSVKHRELL